MSSVLMKAETNEITDEHCWQIYRENKAEFILQKFPGGSISNLICANSTVSDTCQGQLLFGKKKKSDLLFFSSQAILVLAFISYPTIISGIRESFMESHQQE